MIEINELIKEALKSKEQEKLRAYRNLKAEFQFYTRELTEDEMYGIVRKSIKKLKKSMEDFKSQGRDDLFEEYRVECEILNSLLPADVSVDENTIITALRESPFFSDGGIPKAKTGEAIKYILSKYPTADGKTISNIIREKL